MAVVTGAHWFGPADRPLLGWVSRPADGPVVAVRSRPGVVVVPPLAYEAWTTHRTLRRLAERLAAQGHLALRLDLSGTGDAAGDSTEIDDVRRWQADVTAAVAELRRLGAPAVALVGMRFGALLALAAADLPGVNEVVAWWPPDSARAHVRELRLLSTVPPGADPVAGPRVVAGVTLTRGFVETAGRVDPGAGAAGRTVLVLDRHDRPPVDALTTSLREAGATVEVVVAPEAWRCLDTATEHATVPEASITTIATWLSARPTAAATVTAIDAVAPDPTASNPTASDPAASASDPIASASDPIASASDPIASAIAEPPTLIDAATFASTAGGPLVHERVCRITAAGLVAIETTPANGATSSTVVFVNSGSEHHVGPGRSWVELGRRLAAEGHRVLRVDFRGWGESPDDGLAPGRPFDAHTVDDVAAIARALAGDGPVVLAGLCAGAWSALRRCEQLPVAGILALNPPLYWEPGDHIEATMAETRIRVERERPHVERLARWRMWTLADLVRWPVRGARWLARLASAGPQVWIVCTPDDDGREHLLRQLARPLRRARRSPTFRFVELPSLDHSVHHPWARDELLDQLRALLHEVGKS